MSSAVVIGGGSAGQRHANLLREMGYSPVFLCSRSQAQEAVAQGIRVVRDLKEVDFSGVTVGAVASPAPFHHSHASALRERAIPVLIEKPLADRMTPDLEAWVREMVREESPVAVGYNLRFHPGLRALMKLVTDGAYGPLRRLQAYAGQDLTRWRKGRDYRQTVSAQKALGGGCLLELSHEIDYLRWLGGEMENVSGTIAQSGTLEIDVEDSADVKIEFCSGATGELHLNMLEFPFRRFCELEFEHGTARWDYMDNRVRIKDGSDQGWKVIWEEADYMISDTYRQQWKACFQLFETGHVPDLARLPDGVGVLNVVDSIRRSSESGCKTVALDAVVN